MAHRLTMLNAKFKGKHDAEFAWFSAGAGAPLISNGRRSRGAGKSFAGVRRGQPFAYALPLVPAARSSGTRCFQISPATP